MFLSALISAFICSSSASDSGRPRRRETCCRLLARSLAVAISAWIDAVVSVMPCCTQYLRGRNGKAVA